jgi:AcrR family transcriptional regulator
MSSNAPPPRRTYPKGRATRQAIVDTAIPVFARMGYHGTSLRDIAARAGLTTAGVLHHFASKEQLLDEVLAQREQRMLAARGQADAERPFDHERRSVAHHQEERELAALATMLSAEAADPEHPAHASVAERYRADVRSTRRTLERAQRAGHVRADLDLDAAARLVRSVSDGLRTQWLLDPTIDMTAAFEEFVRGYLRGPGRHHI